MRSSPGRQSRLGVFLTWRPPPQLRNCPWSMALGGSCLLGSRLIVDGPGFLSAHLDSFQTGSTAGSQLGRGRAKFRRESTPMSDNSHNHNKSFSCRTSIGETSTLAIFLVHTLHTTCPLPRIVRGGQNMTCATLCSGRPLQQKRKENEASQDPDAQRRCT